MRIFSMLSLLFGISLNLFAGSFSFVGRCVSVIDGDTVDVSKDGNIVRIRLEGIDCPERNQPRAEESKAFTANLLNGKSINVIEKEKDDYGRTVARVFVDGRDVSVELLKAGLASHSKKYNSDWLLARLEEQAKADRIGIWASTPGPVSDEKRMLLSSESMPTRSATRETSRIIYHGNVNSRVFHSPSCRNYSCKKCTREFTSREEAIAAGFRPCGQCRP